MSKCPNCSGDTFEMESVPVRNAPTELFSIKCSNKCSNCETVITMIPPYWDTASGSVISQMDYLSDLFHRRKK